MADDAMKPFFKIKSILVISFASLYFAFVFNHISHAESPSYLNVKNGMGTRGSSYLPKKAMQLKDIPKDVIEPCLDETGRIADVKADWNYSDTDMGTSSPPRSRLVEACISLDKSWTVVCEKGGYGVSHILIQSRFSKGKNTLEVSHSTILPKYRCAND